eukprot:IDg21039t1
MDSPVKEEYRDFRSYMKHESLFGKSYFKEVLFTFTELVEKEIVQARAGTSGAILHDGWEHFGTNYFAVYASFMSTSDGDNDGSGEALNLMQSLICGNLNICSSTTVSKFMIRSTALLQTTLTFTSVLRFY